MLLDRIDLQVEVPPVKFREISSVQIGETSATIRDRVVSARKRQQARFAKKPPVTCNARMGPRELQRFGALDDGTKEMLKHAMSDLNLSARAYDRILKVARTMASRCDDLIQRCIALNFRSLPRCPRGSVRSLRRLSRLS